MWQWATWLFDVTFAEPIRLVKVRSKYLFRPDRISTKYCNLVDSRKTFIIAQAIPEINVMKFSNTWTKDSDYFGNMWSNMIRPTIITHILKWVPVFWKNIAAEDLTADAADHEFK